VRDSKQARPLPDRFRRILVFPNFEKDRLPQTIIPGPFHKFDLADHYSVGTFASLIPAKRLRSPLLPPPNEQNLVSEYKS
jgi:hypothetical protein